MEEDAPPERAHTTPRVAWREPRAAAPDACASQVRTGCDTQSTCELRTCCGSAAAPLYFISFYVLAAYITLNLLVAVIVDNFGGNKDETAKMARPLSPAAVGPQPSRPAAGPPSRATSTALSQPSEPGSPWLALCHACFGGRPRP